MCVLSIACTRRRQLPAPLLPLNTLNDVHLLLWVTQAAEISPMVPLFRQPLCAARPAAALREVAVLHDQRHVATRDTDGNLALWDVTTACALLRACHDTRVPLAGWCCAVNVLGP